MAQTLLKKQQATFLTLDNGDEILINKWDSELTDRITAYQNGGVHEQESFSAIPLIDLSRIYCDDFSECKAVAKEIRQAAHVVGFFYAKNHGVGDSFIDEVWSQARRFFSLEQEQKMEVWTKKASGAMMGYHPPLGYNREGRKYRELHEAFDCQGEFGIPRDHQPGGKRQNLWPENLPGFREGLLAYHAQMTKLSRCLTRSFALALDLPEDYFDAIMKEPKADLRITHYPPQDRQLDQVGIGAHTDFNAFTLLKQDDIAGLQVLNKHGEFINVPPMPGTYVVNIGDLLQRQSNDYFRSTLHRVVNTTGRERYSVPYFFSYDPHELVEVVSSCISEENPAKYPPITTAAYDAMRAERSKSGKSYASRKD